MLKKHFARGLALALVCCSVFLAPATANANAAVIGAKVAACIASKHKGQPQTSYYVNGVYAGTICLNCGTKR